MNYYKYNPKIDLEYTIDLATKQTPTGFTALLKPEI